MGEGLGAQDDQIAPRQPKLPETNVVKGETGWDQEEDGGDDGDLGWCRWAWVAAKVDETSPSLNTGGDKRNSEGADEGGDEGEGRGVPPGDFPHGEIDGDPHTCYDQHAEVGQ